MASLSDVADFADSIGSSIADTVTAIKLKVPYQNTPQTRPAAAPGPNLSATALGGVSLITIVVVGVGVLVAFRLLKK